MTRLSVNLNKIAVLRNSRGGDRPEIVQATHRDRGRRAGHHPASTPDAPRPACGCTRGGCSHRWPGRYNLEGNPRAGAGRYRLPGAGRRGSAGSGHAGAGFDSHHFDHGFDLDWDIERLTGPVAALKRSGARQRIRRCRRYFRFRSGTGNRHRPDRDLHRSVRPAHADGDALKVLNSVPTAKRPAAKRDQRGARPEPAQPGPFLHALPTVAEVSIGHALIDDLYAGLDATVELIWTWQILTLKPTG